MGELDSGRLLFVNKFLLEIKLCSSDETYKSRNGSVHFFNVILLNKIWRNIAF